MLNNPREKDLRILPPFIVDEKLKRVLFVAILMSHIKDLGVIKNLMMEAKDFLVLGVH